MKTAILILMLSLPLLAHAQKAERYCEIVVTQDALLSPKATIYDVDLGTDYKHLGTEDRTLNDFLFKTKTFATPVVILNLVATYGWQLVSESSIKDKQVYVFKKAA